MAASTQSAPAIGQLKQVAYTACAGTERTLSIEQLPGTGYRMPLVTMIHFWDIHGHMKSETYPTNDSLLDDAAPGWKSWQESTLLPALADSEETAIIKAALHRADIHPKRVRHYRGPVIITMDRPEKYEGEFLQIETLAWQALDAAPNARNLCSGIHVFSQFHGKLAAGYERFRRCKR